MKKRKVPTPLANVSKRKSARSPAGVVSLRNSVAANPLLRKSAAHGKTRKAQRRMDTVKLRKHNGFDDKGGFHSANTVQTTFASLADLLCPGYLSGLVADKI